MDRRTVSFLPLLLLSLIFPSVLGIPTLNRQKREGGRDCNFNGETHKDGDVFASPNSICIKYACDDGSVGIVEEGCNSDGNCKAVGSVFDKKCHLYRCDKLTQNGYLTYKTTPVEYRCTDMNGDCFSQGSLFALSISGKVYQRCTCQLDGNKLKYSCGPQPQGQASTAPKDCTIEDATFKDGETFSIPGRSNCLKYLCSNGGYSLVEGGCESGDNCFPAGAQFEENCHIYECVDKENYFQTVMNQTRCTDAYGVCHDPGSTFDFVINDKTYDSCTCSVDGTHIKYSCGSGGGGGGGEAPEPSGSCTVKGVTYENGQNFTIPGQPKCFVHLCTDGSLSLIEEGCEVNGVCHDVDSQFAYGCDTYTCTKDGNTYSTSALTRRCRDVNGDCKEQGETFSYMIEGKTHTNCSCSLANNTMEYSCTGGSGHSDDCKLTTGEDYKDGENFTIAGHSKCFIYECSKGSVSLIKGGCDVDGTCRDVDSTFERGTCDTYTCKMEVAPSGGTWYRTTVSERRCQDVNGTCHDFGTTFSKKSGDIVYDNCTCFQDSENLKYRCYATRAEDTDGGCIDDGKSYEDGEVFVKDGTSDCIKFLCSNGQITLAQEACSVNGTCQPVGSSYDDGCFRYKCVKEQNGNQITLRFDKTEMQCRDANGNCYPFDAEFPHKIHRKVYPNCTCHMGQGGKIVYSCVDALCETDGHAYTHGERFTISTESRCVKYLCWHGGWSISQGACEVDGDCYPEDTEYQIDCKHYTCKSVIRNGMMPREVFEPKFIQEMDECIDASGQCHELGGDFTKQVGGKTYDDCKCSTDVDHTFYACPINNQQNNPEDCIMNDKIYEDGALFSLNAATPCIKYRCAKGKITVAEEGCQMKGQCYAVGERFTKDCGDVLQCYLGEGLPLWTLVKFGDC